MPYSFKERAKSYLDDLKGSGTHRSHGHALRCIIAMMWQAGVDRFEDLPDEETFMEPSILAAELSVNTPLDEVTSGLPDPRSERTPDTPEKINAYFKTFKDHKEMQDPAVLTAEELRREMHRQGLLTPGELSAIAAYRGNEDHVSFKVYGEEIDASDADMKALVAIHDKYRVVELLPYSFFSFEDEKKDEAYRQFRVDATEYVNGGDKEYIKDPKAFYQKWEALRSLPQWLDRTTKEKPISFNNIELFQGEDLTLYDIMAQNGRIPGRSGIRTKVDLDTYLRENDIPMPKVKERRNQRWQEIQAQQKAAQGEIEKNGWPLIADVRQKRHEREKDGSSVTGCLYQIWALIDRDRFPDETREGIERMRDLSNKIACKGDGYVDPLCLTDTNLLEVYKKTVKDLPKLMMTEIETPKKYQSQYGEKMTYLTYFREENRDRPNGGNVGRFEKYIKDIENCYGLKVDLSKAIELSDKEIAEAPMRRKQEARKAWAKERQGANMRNREMLGEDSFELRQMRKQERAKEKAAVGEISDTISVMFPAFSNHMQMVKGTFGTKNKSLQPLKNMIDGLTQLASNEDYRKRSDYDERLIRKIFDIRAETLRIAALSKTKKDPERENLIGAIAEECNKFITDPRMTRIVDAYLTQGKVPDLDQEENEGLKLEEGLAPSVRDLVAEKRDAFKKLPSMTDVDTKDDIVAYRDKAAKMLSEVIVAELYADAFQKHNTSVEEQTRTLQDKSFQEIFQDHAKEIRERPAFQYMMDRAGLSPMGLLTLVGAGSRGKIMAELAECQKLVEHKQAAASAPEKKPLENGGMVKK